MGQSSSAAQYDGGKCYFDDAIGIEGFVILKSSELWGVALKTVRGMYGS